VAETTLPRPSNMVILWEGIIIAEASPETREALIGTQWDGTNTPRLDPQNQPVFAYMTPSPRDDSAFVNLMRTCTHQRDTGVLPLEPRATMHVNWRGRWAPSDPDEDLEPDWVGEEDFDEQDEDR